MNRAATRPDDLDLDSPGRRDYRVALEHDSIRGDHLIPLTVFWPRVQVVIVLHSCGRSAVLAAKSNVLSRTSEISFDLRRRQGEDGEHGEDWNHNHLRSIPPFLGGWVERLS